MDGPIGCVWDLGVICAEREAWTKYMMRVGGPDVERLSQRPKTRNRLHMRFDEILDRLASFPENSITFYDQAGVPVTKRYPEVLADIRQTVVRLQEWGVEPGMRVGILATNSYEWVVYDIALAHLKCTSVAFPEEFNLHTSSELIEKYNLALLLLSRRDKWPAITPGSSTVYIEDENPTGVEVSRRVSRDIQPGADFLIDVFIRHSRPDQVPDYKSARRGRNDCQLLSLVRLPLRR